MTEDYFDKAISFGALYKAMKICCNNVRWKDSVVGYEANGLKNTLTLRNDILAGRYKISEYQKFRVFEPKEREITASRIRDRQFQRSMCNNGLYDDIAEHLIRDSFACQKGKGVDDAHNRLKVLLGRYYRKYGNSGWVLKCDVRKFFDSMSHDSIKNAMGKYISDKRVLAEVCRVVDSFDGERGIGLGSQISQLTGLILLNDLDHYIKEKLRIKCYVRYMDDFILVHPDKEHLKRCRKEIGLLLEDIGLELNQKTTLQPLRQGFVFLKWKYIFSDTGKVLMLMPSDKVKRQRKRLRKIIRMEAEGELPTGTAKQSLQSFLANAKRGNTYRIQSEIIKFYKEETANARQQQGNPRKKAERDGTQTP